MKHLNFALVVLLTLVVPEGTWAAEDKICGAKRLAERWRFTAPAGWVANDLGGRLVDGYMFLPPGKEHKNSDRALVLAGFTKIEAGHTLEIFGREARRRYASTYPGGPSPEAATLVTAGAKVQLYRLRPGPNLGYTPGWETQTYIEDASCFILVTLTTRSADAQKKYESDLLHLVRSFGKR